ncbi:infection structure specific protein [Seiridium cupressi]|uniref:Infection structure specific protein n=1 Tax=Seiridium unicorne TaxID=138068 RepID=A0ABR2VF27_9PEZI
MYTKTFAVATLVAAASAQLPAVVRRDFLEARQTASLDAACQSAVASVLPLYQEIPTPPEDLQSVTLPADPCETPSFTGTLASEYSSYTSEVLDWYTSHSAELLSALASCTELASYASEVPVCSSFASGALSSATAGATTTDDSSASATATGGSSSATGAGSSAATATGSASATKTGAASVSQAGGARETGFVAGVIAAAGFVGAVAVAL